MTSAPAIDQPDADRPDADRPRRPGHLDLLVTLILLQVGESFLSADSAVQRALFNVLFLAIILSAIRTLSKSILRMRIAVAIGMVGYALSWYSEFHQSTELIAAIYSCYIIVFTLLVVALAESVFGNGLVDFNRIVGAICVYFVTAIIWALVFSLLETVQPGSFDLPTRAAEPGIQQNLVSQFMYFSNVTLTTLGYGDILPVSRPARMLAGLEAMIGQVFLAFVVARLVGLHIAQNRQ